LQEKQISRTIPDPNAVKPEDWNEQEDGKWEPPQIENPEWKGEWKPKKIPNPKYKVCNYSFDNELINE